ncbi:hypothetical protein Tco_0809273, partial [Tanacetum coccineum]
MEDVCCLIKDVVRLRVLSLSLNPSAQVYESADIWNFHVCNEKGYKKLNLLLDRIMHDSDGFVSIPLSFLDLYGYWFVGLYLLLLGDLLMGLWTSQLDLLPGVEGNVDDVSATMGVNAS